MFVVIINTTVVNTFMTFLTIVTPSSILILIVEQFFVTKKVRKEILRKSKIRRCSGVGSSWINRFLFDDMLMIVVSQLLGEVVVSTKYWRVG